MASYEAAINLVVNGQQKIDRLLGSIDSVAKSVERISAKPVNLNLGEATREITSLSAKVENALKSQVAAREAASKKVEAAFERFSSTIVKNNKIVQDSEARGATQTKKYLDAVAKRDRAIQNLGAAQQEYARKIKEIDEAEDRLRESNEQANASYRKTAQTLKAVNQLVNNYVSGATRASRSKSFVPANLQEQIGLFKQLANSVDFTSSAYRRFTLAGFTAQLESGQESIRKFQILSDSLSRRQNTRKPSFAGIDAIDYAGPRQAVQELIQSFPSVARSQAALEDYRDQLSSIQRLVPIASSEFVRLGGAIKQVDDILSRVSSRDTAKQFGPVAAEIVKGPATDLVTQGLAERQKFTERSLRVEQRLFSLNEKIEDTVSDQTEKSRLLVQSNQALNALTEGRLEDAARELSIIERQRQALARLAKQQKAGGVSVFGAAGTGFSPVGGDLPSGIIGGSPRDQQRRLRSRLSFQTFFAQAEDVRSRQATSATQDAVRLAQQRAREIERTTAKLWREFGGPALPPGMRASGSRASSGAGISGQAFRAGGPGAATASLGSPRRLASQINSAILLQERLNGLEIKGVSTSAERAAAQRIINELSDKNLQYSDQTLNSYDDQINALRDFIRLQGQVVANEKARAAASKKGGGAELSGFAADFKKAQDAISESKQFFAGTSPEQAYQDVLKQFNVGQPVGAKSGSSAAAQNIIDTFASSMKRGASKITSSTFSVFAQATQAINDAFGIASPSRFIIEVVKNLADTYISQLEREYPRIKAATERAFGQESPSKNVKTLVATNRGFGFAERPSTGYSPLGIRSFDPSGAGGEMDEMFRRFRNQIAQLTTQPEIYRNILNALPSSQITTDIAGAASRRANAVENLPSFLGTQRQLGAGELEKAIQAQLAQYLKGIRIPNPWVGPIGDYKEFISRISEETDRLARQQLQLPPGAERKALPPGVEPGSQFEQRILEAYQKSDERARRVLAEDLANSISRGLLPPGGAVPPGGGGGGAAGAGAAPGGGGNQPPNQPGRASAAALRNLSSAELSAFANTIDAIQQNLSPTTAGFDRLNDELTRTRRLINIEQAARDPEATFLARRRVGPRASAAISEGLIGGAFPLLFGQGIGASIGGGIGGAAGGFAGGGLGFGLSLIGTALGTALDQLSTAAQETGRDLRYPTEAFDKLREAGLLAGRQIDFYTARLIELGFVQEAQARIQFEIAKRIGVTGSNDLVRLGQASSKLSNAWAELNLQLQAAIAGPLTGLLQWVTGIVEASNRRGRTEAQTADIVAGLSPADKKLFQQRVQEELGKSFPVVGFGSGALTAADQAAALRSRVAAEFASRSKPQRPEGEISPEEKLKNELGPIENFIKTLETRLSAIDLGRNLISQVRSAANEQQDLDRQRYDLIESYEKSIEDIRLNVERRVIQEQQKNLQLQNEIYAAQGDLRLQQLQNENAAIREGLRGNEIGQQALDIVNQYTEKQLSTENEIENRRRALEAEIYSINIEADQYKLDVARQVSDLNKSTAKQIEQIQLGVLRRNQDYDRNRFEIEKQIAVAKLQAEQITARRTREELSQALEAQSDPARQQSIRQSIDNLDKLLATGPGGFSGLIGQISQLRPPARASFQPTAVGAGVSTAQVESLAARSIELKKRIAELQNSITDLVKSGDIQSLNSSFLSLADQGAAELTASFQDARFELKQILDLVSPGEVSPRLRGLQAGLKAAFESPGIQSSPFIKEFKQLFDFYGKLAEQNEKLIATTKFFEESISSNTEEISSLKEEVNELVGGFTAYEQALTSLAQRGLSPASEEAQELLASAKEIDRVRDKIEVITAFRDAAIGLSDSLKGLVSDFVQLGSASEAVKAFNQRISSGVTNFVLELAFKPVEQALQKQFFAFAEELGFDVKPEALKQLEELQTIRLSVSEINKQIAGLLNANVSFGERSATTGATPFSVGGATSSIDLLRALGDPTLAPNVANTLVRAGAISPLQADSFVRQVLDAARKLYPNYQAPASTAPGSIPATPNSGYPAGTPQSQMLLPGNDMPSYRPPFAPGGPIPRNLPAWDPRWGNPVRGLSGEELNRRYYNKPINSLPGDFTGIGGPDLPRQVFPIPDEPVKVEVVNPAAGLVPLSESSTGVTPLQVTPYGTTPSATSPVPAGMGQQMNEDAIKYGEGVKQVTGATQQAATEIVGSGNKAAAGALTWQKSLGQVVTGLGMAASSIIGIAGGVQQIQEGGTGNILSGIGSILTTVGGIGLSLGGGLGGLFGGGGGGGVGPVAQAAGITPRPGFFGPAFAKGGVVNSPTLFQFANGGSLNNGLMGEAGPEAIMPLKRGPDGRLGVEQVSEGGDSSSRLREAMGRSPAQGGQSSEVRIKFETTVINGVEYVSKDQLDQAMEQTRKASISEGAKRGMGMTLDKLKQSPSTRSRVGIR